MPSRSSSRAPARSSEPDQRVIRVPRGQTPKEALARLASSRSVTSQGTSAASGKKIASQEVRALLSRSGTNGDNGGSSCFRPMDESTYAARGKRW